MKHLNKEASKKKCVKVYMIMFTLFIEIFLEIKNIDFKAATENNHSLEENTAWHKRQTDRRTE